jgi:DNA replicative helicase MCM subunit Mcm2 (Cdc46/Mcm family)
MKKLDKRYLKKLNIYWTKMEKYFIHNISLLNAKTWFDMHHIHTDWEGKGNNNPINRNNSIYLIYKCLEYTEEFTLKYPKEIQTWIFIHENSYDDAIYIHTHNDNKSQYPYNFEGNNTSWNITDNPYLNKIVDINIYKIGKMINTYGTIYVVTKI